MHPKKILKHMKKIKVLGEFELLSPYIPNSPEFTGDFNVVLDALHTQDLTAQKLFFERGADYVMTVKANQKSLYQTLETKLQTQAFSPSADAGDASLPART